MFQSTHYRPFHRWYSQPISWLVQNTQPSQYLDW